MSYKTVSGCLFREKERGERGGKVSVLKEFFQAYGKHSVDLQCDRGFRGQKQAYKAFSVNRCCITQEIWQPKHRLLQ